MARKREKRRAIGICDLCGGVIQEPYTVRGLPRLYCSTECRNTGNSRDGAAIIAAKTRESFARGERIAPILLEDPTVRKQRARHAAAVRAETLRAEVQAGTWRNPALSDEARTKLSRPRTTADNPVLHAAIEKRRRTGMAGLTPEEHAAYMRNERERIARDPEYPAKRRAQYARRQERKGVAVLLFIDDAAIRQFTLRTETTQYGDVRRYYTARAPQRMILVTRYGLDLLTLRGQVVDASVGHEPGWREFVRAGNENQEHGKVTIYRVSQRDANKTLSQVLAESPRDEGDNDEPSR